MGHNDALKADLRPNNVTGADLDHINEYEYNIIHDDLSKLLKDNPAFSSQRSC